jgi:3-hydroxyisobutyrate dehydrogenase
MKAGTVAIECSTLTVDWVRELACEAIKREVGFLDAPVTGSKAQAAGGTLRFLVGGDAATFASAEPVLSAMGSEAIALGPVGSGAVLKLINNFLCGVQVATLAEALVMIERSGLDLQRAADILVDGAPGSPLLKALAQRMITADYAPHFHPPLMAKDLAYAIAAFAGEGIDLVTAAAARQRFEAAAPTYAEADIAAIIEPIRIARG